MATFLLLSASSPSPVSPDTTKIPSTNHRWSLAQELNFIPNPSKQSNYFNGHLSHADELSMKHKAKLREARDVLNKVEDPFEGLMMTDALQRLSIGHHFQEEISHVLHSQYLDYLNTTSFPDHDLYEVSTRFRLLRQQGYNMPADVFYNFTDKERQFKSTLCKDIRGLRGLYEASQLSMEGEDILDEASVFSAKVLNGWLNHLDEEQSSLVRTTLMHPYHKSPARVMSKNVVLSGWPWAALLQDLSKLDFDMVKATSQQEVLQVSKWWKETGLAQELKSARDQPLKWYMWALEALTDPSLSEQRMELTKPISFVYLIDDIFDVYGTLEELTLFTQTVKRWEIDGIEQLPDYMKSCFRSLYEVTNQIAEKAHQEHGWNPIHTLRKSWGSLCDAFLVEAKWFASGRLPSAQDYLENGIISSGIPLVLVHLFFLLGQGFTDQTVHLLNHRPPRLVTSAAAILRLWDDLGSAKDEEQEGHDGSYVQCYMKEHKGCSTESARNEVIRLISQSWKQINRECLNPKFPATFTKASLNFARMSSLMYSYDDNHSLPILEDYLNSMHYGDSLSN
ncbi:S-linalool synthase [Bertholletia excelsa]